MEGDIDYFVAGIGTGGTICGTGRYLKEKDPSIKVIAVDPFGSVFYEYFKTGKLGTPHSYSLEGLGDEEIIECPDFSLIDEMIQVCDKESFIATRNLHRGKRFLPVVRQVLQCLGYGVWLNL